ncbi:MFS transporter [Paenibacillus macerans]|uniref:MFS transporter n=1 Tax=Paenibacillus macerans TaxID=44252 RepID=UPI00203EEAA3|nr:MFS transporter [Paenibacillus macerans]MCM3699799.1 MFS transporter [Paenibacillus macerans]
MTNRKISLFVLLVMQGLSMLGSRLTAVAIGIWLVKEQGSVTPLLLISLFQELPALVVGMWLGLAVDRFNRIAVIITADTGQAVGTLLLLVSITSGNFELWHLYAIVALQGVFAAMQAPAVSAVTYQTVEESELDRTNAIRELLFPLTGVIASVLAGMLYAPLSISGIVLLDMMTFGLAVIVTLCLRLPGKPENAVRCKSGGSLESTGLSDLWIEALQGFAFLAEHRGLLVLALCMAWWNFILNGPLELAIPYLLGRTGSEVVMSLLLVAMNAGALTGAVLVLAGLTFRRRLLPMFIGTIVTAVMFVVFGIANNAWVLGVAVFLLMLPLPMTGALFTSLVQLHTPDNMQGRVFAAIGQLNAVTAPLSFIVTGPLVDRWLEPALRGPYGSGAGIGLLLAVAGILLLLGAVPAYLNKKVRELE